MKIDQEDARARPVRRLAVPDDGAPPQRCPCCPCRGAEKAWLVAIRPSDSIALPRDRRSVVGVGLKGGLVDRGHELPRRHRHHKLATKLLIGRIGLNKQSTDVAIPRVYELIKPSPHAAAFTRPGIEGHANRSIPFLREILGDRSHIIADPLAMISFW